MSKKLTEIEIVTLCKNGDQNGQRALYNRYYSSMLSLCTRYVSDQSIAKEIVNDAMLKIFNKIYDFEFNHNHALRGWISKIVVNESLMYLRRKNKFLTISTPVETDIADYNSWSLDAIDIRIIFQAIQSLPDGYRVVFNMFAIEGYSHREIADALGISEGASRSQLTHARKKLQKTLKELL